ncbi:IS3 family transposase [Paenibacillus sp. E194]|uniref:IS3 family transposase n=1 Tax=Paenibacillus sp. E194 TaxID=1458845 RepID=UPI0009E4BF90
MAIYIYRLHPYFGYLRMMVTLKREGVHANNKRVYRPMKKLGICSVIRTCSHGKPDEISKIDSSSDFLHLTHLTSKYTGEVISLANNNFIRATAGN